MDIYIIGAAPLVRLIKKYGYKIFAITIVDIKKALTPKKDTNLAAKVPKEYYKYLDIFSRKEADKLPKYRIYDYKIILKDGK